MSTIVAAEHFTLTPALKAKVEESMDRLEGLLPEGATVRVFLSSDARGVFTALFRLHLRKQEIVCKDTGADLYVAINHAAGQVRKILLERRKQRMREKRAPLIAS